MTPEPDVMLAPAVVPPPPIVAATPPAEPVPTIEEAFPDTASQLDSLVAEFESGIGWHERRTRQPRERTAAASAQAGLPPSL